MDNQNLYQEFVEEMAREEKQIHQRWLEYYYQKYKEDDLEDYDKYYD